METKDMRLKCIEWACWSFFVISAIAVGRWVILRFVCWAGWGNPDWAAWVQAIGSIAAIAAATWIAGAQHRNELARENSRSATCRANTILRAVLEGVHVRKVINEFIRKLRKKDSLPLAFSDFQRGRLQVALRGLEALSFDDLQHADAICIASSIIMVTELHSAMAASTGVGHSESVAKNLERFNVAIADEMEKLCSAYISITGHHPIPEVPAQPESEPQSNEHE